MIAVNWARPWISLSEFYSWTTVVLSVLVAATIFAEFYRGARVIRGHTRQNLLAAMVHLTRRNTRRYGGYLVHFGVVLIMIGFAGSAFNQEREAEMGLGDTMQIGRYTLVGKTFTQDDNANYVVTLAVTDKDGGVGTDSKTITINNVSPSVTLSPVAPINEGDAATLTPISSPVRRGE